jgi:hypothetical protein
MASLVPAIHGGQVEHRDNPGDDDRGYGDRVAGMSWFRRWQLRRAAKQYARRLGPHLQRAYGAAEHYSVPQICSAAAKLGLNPEFIVLGLAVFLSEAEFASRASEMRVYIPYDEARELVAHFRPTSGFGSSHHYESGLGMVGGLDLSGDGGSA